MILQVPAQQQPIVTWEPLPADFILPDEPVENIQQPVLAAALTDALGAANLIQPQMLLASNLGIVANVNDKTVVKAPDWFYVPQVLPIPAGMVRHSYTPNLEGEPVAIAIEFLSDTDGGEYSVRPTYPYGKLFFYEQILQVSCYVTFDPYQPYLEVRRLENQHYALQAASEDQQFWIPELNLFLGMWYGTRLGMTMHWLRWWNLDGQLLLWSSEVAEQERQRAEAERQRAEAALADLELQRQQNQMILERLQTLGVDPEELA